MKNPYCYSLVALLLQGEYVAPEKIENIYMSSEVVGQVLVHGNSLKVGLCSTNSLGQPSFSGYIAVQFHSENITFDPNR